MNCILGLSWALGYLYIAQSSVFAYLFTLLNSSQGISIFIVHVCLNNTVRDALTRYLDRKRTAAIEFSNSLVS
jgi:hypothetical protein